MLGIKLAQGPVTACRTWASRHHRPIFLLHLAGSVIVVCCAIIFGFYPALVTARVALSSTLRQQGRIESLGSWFLTTERRYDRWVKDYYAKQHAITVNSQDVAGTEWPMFGSAFFILSAEELLKSKDIELTDHLRASLRSAAQLIADPVSATWVRKKWGPGYLEKENVFYRMLLILGLNAYGTITNDRKYAAIAMNQAQGLSREFNAAQFNVLDDYPGECYPADVLWATAAIARVSDMPRVDRDRLSNVVVATLSGRFSDTYGLPATLVDSRTGHILQGSRGCSTSGLLSFAYELDPRAADGWYASYVEHYWFANRWIAGFREHAAGSQYSFTDVDSGPILFGIGTVASLFGVGAARSAGRYDQAAPLTMQAVAVAWPTPFGLLVPGIMGWAAADGWCFGETAFLFAMTRPNNHGSAVKYSGRPPLVLLGFIILYGAMGAGLILREWVFWRRRFQPRKSPP